MVKNGYYGNDGFLFAWDLGVIFFRRTKLEIGGFSKKNFF